MAINATKYIKNIETKLKAGKKLTDREVSLFKRFASSVESSTFPRYCKSMTNFEFPWFQDLIMEEAQKIYEAGSGRLMFQVVQQHGKLLSDDTLCKLDIGWVRNGDLRPGDNIDSGQGFYSKILAIHPQKNVQMYKVTFKDGRSINCCIDHLWEIRCSKFKKNKTKVLTTKQILEHISIPLNESMYIPRYIPIDDNKYEPLLLYSYSLGALSDKFILDEYLKASYPHRKSIIQGMMDSNGHIISKGNKAIEYHTSSLHVASCFQKLIFSIGGSCKIKKHKRCLIEDENGTFSKNIFHCRVRIENPEKLFSDETKKNQCSKVYTHKEKNKYLKIKSIEKSIIEDATCLTVDNERGLYVAENYIVTHNTKFLGTLFPSYILGKNPDWKVLYLTYSETRAKEVAADLLEQVTNPKYQKMFPNFKLKDELSEEVRVAIKRRNKLTVSNFTNANSSTGEFKAAGIEGSYNGFSANLIIVDDYFNGMADAMSDQINFIRWGCFTRNILTRQQKDTIIIVIGTQWRDDDIIGNMGKYIQNPPEGALKWKHIILNALKDERDYPYDHRKIGEYLWPEYKMNFYLEYKTLDPIGWDITAMNKPDSLMLKMFNEESFRIYDVVPNLTGATIIISCDPNYSKIAKKGDDCAVVVVAITQQRIYLLDFWNEPRVSHRDTMNQINIYKEKYPTYLSVLIEDKAGGEALYQLFEEEGEYKIERFISQENKRTRAQFLLPHCRRGAVYIPSSRIYPRISVFTSQFYAFTGDGGIIKDDLVDALVQVACHYGYMLNPPINKNPTYKIKNMFSRGGQVNRLMRGKVFG